MKHSSSWGLTSLLIIAITGGVASADLRHGCELIENWDNCKEEWQELGLSTKRLEFTMNLASDAYFPYDQVENGQEPDLTQPLRINGKTRKTAHRYSSKISSMPKNHSIFYGVTGTYGMRKYAPMGFVYFEPSVLEKVILTHPGIVQEKGMNFLKKRYSKKRLIAVSYRGTRSNVYDLSFTDFSFRKKLAPDYTGRSRDPGVLGVLDYKSEAPKVHGGFQAAFESSFDEVQKYIRHFMYERLADIPGMDTDTAKELIEKTEVITTGHSLGGALATLSGYVLAQRPDLAPQAMKVYTYSQPKVGNSAFVEDLKKKNVTVFRIYRDYDIVPMVPGNIPGVSSYAHAGEELRIGDLTKNVDGYSEIDKIMPRHSMHGLRKGISNFLNTLSEYVDDALDFIADEIDELFDDYDYDYTDYYDQDLYYDYEYDEYDYDEYDYDSNDEEQEKPQEENPYQSWWSWIGEKTGLWS